MLVHLVYRSPTHLSTYMSELLHDVQLTIELPIKDSILEELTLRNLLGRKHFTVPLGSNLPDRCKGPFARGSDDVVPLTSIPTLGELGA